MMNKWYVQIIGLLALSAVLALAINFMRDDGIALLGNWPSRTAEAGEPVVPPSAEEGDPPFITLDDAVALYQSPGIIFIDARDPEDYASGHITRSINIPFDYLDDDWKAHIDRLDRSARYVIYCSGSECESSLFLGRYFRDLGFVNVSVFYGGWSEWEINNLPINRPKDGGGEQS